MIASVVIPTCNRNADLAVCLARLQPHVQSVSAESFEVIVTDDGSCNTARAIIEKDFSQVRWLQGPRQGPAANRNNGARAALGKWLIFLDDDCVPDAGFLDGYLAAIQNDKWRVLEGRTRAADRRTRLDEECPENENGGYLWSCNMAIQRDLFQEMGGFDASFRYPAMEDVDLMTRLVRANEPVNFVPDALVYHPWRRIRGLAFAGKHAESVVYYVGKNPEKRELLSWLHLGRVTLRKTLRQIPRDSLKCGFRGIGNVLAEALYYPIAIRRAVRKIRKQVRSEEQASPTL